MASAYTGFNIHAAYIWCAGKIYNDFFISGLFDILPDFDDSNDGKA